jgi:nucleoside-diphosphate-sugar epimerase
MNGITGFLGSHLAKALLNKGYELIALKRKSSSLQRIESILSGITLCDLEELDFAEFFRSHPEVDVVIHAATCYGRNKETASQIAEVNTNFPLRLLEAAVSAGVKTFINTDTALDKSLNLYSLSKSQFVDWGRYFSLQNKIHFVNMRIEHFYGPGDGDSKFTHYIIKSCIENTPKLKLTAGEQKRDFIYIDDVVSAYLVLLGKMGKLPDGFNEFDVGTGKAISIKDFVKTVHQITQSQSFLDFGAIPYRKGEALFSEADIQPLTQLGWTCKINLEQGLALTIESIKQ